MVQAFDDIAREQLEGIAKSLQLPAATFLPILDPTAVDSSRQSASSLEVVHYMLPADLGAPEACEAHEDKGLLTLIYADTERGLQVSCIVTAMLIITPCKRGSVGKVHAKCMRNLQVQGPDGSWRHLLTPQGQLAVLSGYTLERATCGLIKAAKHKVVCAACCTCHCKQQSVMQIYACLASHKAGYVPLHVLMFTPIGAAGGRRYWQLCNSTNCVSVQAQST